MLIGGVGLGWVPGAICQVAPGLSSCFLGTALLPVVAALVHHPGGAEEGGGWREPPDFVFW